jgi:hypothetical protein
MYCFRGKKTRQSYSMACQTRLQDESHEYTLFMFSKLLSSPPNYLKTFQTFFLHTPTTVPGETPCSTNPHARHAQGRSCSPGVGCKVDAGCIQQHVAFCLVRLATNKCDLIMRLLCLSAGRSMFICVRKLVDRGGA